MKRNGPLSALDIRFDSRYVPALAGVEVEVEVDGGGLFASEVLDPPAWPAPHGAPRVRIRCGGIGGMVHVRRSAARRLLETVVVRGRQWVEEREDGSRGSA